MFAQIRRFNRPAALAFLLMPLMLSAQDKASSKATPNSSSVVSKTRPKNDKRTRVEINTTLGKMVVELYNETPQHRDNFIKLVKGHFYDSLLFHRVIPSFMLQGGDPSSRTAGPGGVYEYPISLDGN